MTEAMPFLQKYDITFLRPPTIRPRYGTPPGALPNKGLAPCSLRTTSPFGYLNSCC